jgi:outer membrane protein insertion porin family
VTCSVGGYPFVFLAGLWLSPLAFGQAAQFEGRPIVDIQYEPADQPVATQDLDRIQPLKKGQPLRLSDVAAAIDGLYTTGKYNDIQVDAEPSGNGVIVRFITTNNWFIGHIAVEGKVSDPPNRGQLVNATQLTLGLPFKEADLKAAEDNLKRLLENNGLYDYQLDTKTERDARLQEVNFVFTLKPGKRAKYEMPVIKGDPRLTDAALIRATGWRILLVHWWRQVTQVRTRNGLDGIRKKYEKQDRLTAQVKLDSLDYDKKRRRVRPNLTVNTGPKVRVKAVEAKISKGKLKSYVPIYEEGAVDRDLLVEGAKNLRDYFQAQGYYDVQVDFREVKQPADDKGSADEMTIEYVIGKGTRYKLVKVGIQGNKYFKTDDIRERLFLAPNSFIMRHGRYSEEFRTKDEEAIKNLYQSNGFRDVKVISTVDNPYQGKTGEIAVTFRIDEGSQWFVDTLDIDGMRKFDKSHVEGDLSSNARQPFSDVSVAADRNTILSHYYSNGFPKATFQYSYAPSDTPNHAHLTYVVTEGPQQFIRDVEISGLKTTRESLVDKTLDVHKDDELSPLKINSAQKQLYDLGVFAKVNTAIQNPEGETDYKYVLYDFEEANRYVLSVGLGAEVANFGGTTSDLSAPGGSTGFSPRFSADLSRLNFRGLGQKVTLHTRFSNLDKRASIDYLVPRFMGVAGRDITYSILYDDSRDVRTFASKREEASVQVAQQLSKPTRVLFRFAYRRVTTSNVIIPALLVPQLLQPVRISILSMNLSQDRRDDPTDPHKGIYNTYDAGVATRFFGGQRSFIRGLGRNATYHRLGRNLVLARQTTFGVILPFSPPTGLGATESVPLPERFFGGGENTHRGFPFNQAGPRDIGTPAGPGGTATQPTGFPLGGNAQLFNTVELRFPLLGSNIGGAVFHDFGNVFRSFHDISFRSSQKNLQDFNYMVHAAGFGVRYRTPIGPVRVDLAYSINPPGYLGFKGTVRDLLSCNPNLPPSALPAVCQPVRQNVSHFQFFFTIGQTF